MVGVDDMGVEVGVKGKPGRVILLPQAKGDSKTPRRITNVNIFFKFFLPEIRIGISL